jgi:hypothetical protein
MHTIIDLPLLETFNGLSVKKECRAIFGSKLKQIVFKSTNSISNKQ